MAPIQAAPRRRGVHGHGEGRVLRVVLKGGISAITQTTLDEVNTMVFDRFMRCFVVFC